MTLASAIFLILGILSCTTVSALDEQDVGNANDYLDQVLENLRKEPEITKHLDPLDVPGEVSESKFKLRNIKVTGLSNLYRQGDCSLSGDNETLQLVAEIAVRNLRVNMDYSAKALFFWIHGDALVTVDHVSVKLDLTSIDGNAKVNSLTVTSLGPYKVSKIRGGTFLLNWLLKIIANKAAQKSRGTIINALENEGKKALDDVLKKHKLPIY